MGFKKPTNEYIKEYLLNNHPSFTVEGSYENAKTKLKFICTTCLNPTVKTWNSVTSAGLICRVCNPHVAHNSLTDEQILYNLHEMHPNLIIYKIKRESYGIKCYYKCKIDGVKGNRIYSEFKTKGCKECMKLYKLKTEQCLNITHPYLKCLLVNPNDGNVVSQHSKVDIRIKCEFCGEERDIDPNYLINHSFSCRRCGGNSPLSEKIMNSILRLNNIKFTQDKTFSWSGRKRYDFYLEDYNIIIEMMGIQHYIQTKRKGGRSLQEEVENDRYKEKIAKENGIGGYYKIDCRNSDIDFIIFSIIDSGLLKYINIDSIDNMSIREDLIIPKAIRIKESYIKNNRNTKLTAKDIGVSEPTVLKYVNMFNQ
jgi:hypothetical protein